MSQAARDHTYQGWALAVLPGTLDLVSRSWRLLEWPGWVRGPEAEVLGRNTELWSLGVLASTGPGAGKLASVTVTPGWTSPDYTRGG